MLGATIGRMTSRRLAAAHRTQAVAQHMMSTTTASNPAEVCAFLSFLCNNLISSLFVQSEVLFDSNMSVRRYILNRPSKLNALTLSVLDKLRAQIEVIRSRQSLSGMHSTAVQRLGILRTCVVQLLELELAALSALAVT
jgi:hypothetical protein